MRYFLSLNLSFHLWKSKSLIKKRKNAHFRKRRKREVSHEERLKQNKVNVIEVKWNRNFFTYSLSLLLVVIKFFYKLYSGWSSLNHVFVVIPFHVFRVDRFFDVFSSNVALNKTDFFSFLFTSMNTKYHEERFFSLLLNHTLHHLTMSYLNMSCLRSEYSHHNCNKLYFDLRCMRFDEFFN